MSILDGTDFKRVGIIDGGDVHSTLLDESDQLQGQLCVFLLSSIFIFAAVEDPHHAVSHSEIACHQPCLDS
jgi:hypothetical protein